MKTAISFAISLYLLLGAAMGSGRADAPLADQIDIPYTKFVLDNGLRLIVHQDRKAPIVAVNVWYHVGSKNEKLGRTGFAHLFEHIMFNGSENWNEDYFKPMEEVGATDLNGTTNNDRTNYFQNVPTNALDLALFLESDRMGHLLGALDQKRLDEQRGVVQNEKRQGENRPYGKTRQLIIDNTYPAGHPYSWSVIGSLEDLDAASLDDVKTWFKSFYGAANAVVVVAGDVDPQDVKARVTKYFGDIAPGPPVDRQDVWIAKRSGVHRQVVEDRVPQSRVYKVWNVPQWGSREGTLLNVVSQILSSGKTSRLYKRLVYEDQIATDAFSFARLNEIGGQFHIRATAHPSKKLSDVEKAVDEELARFIAEGPTQEELDRVRTRYFASFVRGVERIGGFGGKSDLLAQNEVYGGSPDYYKKTLGFIDSTTTEELRQVAMKWLTDGEYVLEVQPFPKLKAAKEGADRSSLPEVGNPPKAEFPELHRTTLSNGLRVVMAQRSAIPVVNFNLIIDAGYAADFGTLAGTASMTASMLDEGTTTRSALQISEQAADLGAQIGSGAGLDTSTVRLSALKSNLDSSLQLFADLVLNPSFPEKELVRLKRQRMASIQREKVSPFPMALRVLPKLLYGDGHAYATPLTGSGTAESTQKLDRDDLSRFHDTWYRPNNATLVVVGDTTIGEIKPRLEELFKGWKSAETPPKKIDPVSLPQGTAVYLIDRPGSQQSTIIAGQLAPPTNNPSEVAIGLMNHVLGGSFTSRINMNLREEKGWSYGAGTTLFGAKGQRPFLVFGPVQSDKTKESIIEINKELRGYLSDRPATATEIERARKSQTLSLPGSWETASAVGRTISRIVTYGLPDDYFETFPEKVWAQDLTQVHAAAQNLIHPGKLTWVVVGDLSKIEAGIRELNLGPVQKLDSDGNPTQ